MTISSDQLLDDPGPTYKGFRLQALYTLLRVLDGGDEHAFQPEGIEDLAVYTSSGQLIEIIQVKSLTSPLVPSSLGSAFYHRAAKHIRDNPIVPITIVSYGPIGLSLGKALEDDEQDKRNDLVKYVAEKIGNEESATNIVSRLRIKKVSEEVVNERILGKLSLLCTGIEPQSALDALWWWVYSAAESKSLLNRTLIIKRITEIGKFIGRRAAFHDEWFKTIIPIEECIITNEQSEALAKEFASGVTARFEHILAGVDVRRDALISRIHDSFRAANVTVIHGASGQGKTALAYRYCHEFFPADWRYRVDFIESQLHARKIALALAGHAEAIAVRILVLLDVQPGNTWWIDLAKDLSKHQTIQVLVTVREEDLRKVYGQLTELDHNDIELILEKGEAKAIYRSMCATHEPPHVLNFQDAWQSFGGHGPLLEFAYFLRHNDTLEGRLKSQIIHIQDAVRRGELQRQELDFLRLAAVGTAYETSVDLCKLADETKVPEPQRTAQLFEKEYFLRLTADGKTHYRSTSYPIVHLVEIAY